VQSHKHATARLCNAKRSRIRHPKPTHGARDRRKQPRPRTRRDRASESGQRHASRRTRLTETGARCPGMRFFGIDIFTELAFFRGFVGFVLSGWACPFWCLCCPACRPSLYVTIDSPRETEKKARQPKIKLGAIARTRRTARLRNAKRSRTRNLKPTHRARDRPEQPQPRTGRDRASEPGRRHASRRTRPTDTGTRCPGKGQR
jgi:hypothetical protein